VYLVTFTLPHDQGDGLRPLYQAVADSYRFAHSGTPWRRMKERIGYVGEARAFESTVGPNGWHPHLHALIFTDRPLDATEQEELRSFFYGRWTRGVVRAGYRAPSPERGVVIVESRLEEYLAKMGLGDELAKGVGKDAEGYSRTALQVLADFRATGDAADLGLWREWNEAMHGARQLTWSRGLRERYATAPEKTDAEIVAAEQDGAEELVASIAPETWYALLRAEVDTTWLLLDAAERGGTEAVETLVERTLTTCRRRTA